jgi:hypothetical protein
MLVHFAKMGTASSLDAFFGFFFISARFESDAEWLELCRRFWKWW